MRKACLPLPLCHGHPRITRDIEDAYLARRILHAHEQNGIRTLFRCFVHIYCIVEAEHENIRIAVKPHIDLAAIFLLTNEIGLIHFPYIMVRLNAPSDQIIARDADKDEEKDRADQANKSAQNGHASAACTLCAASLYVLARVFACQLCREILRIIIGQRPSPPFSLCSALP